MPSPSSPIWTRRGPQLAGRLFLELLVVFFGVYAASMLAQRQAVRAEQEHAVALRQALVTELNYVHSKGAEMDMGEIGPYLAAIESGRRPALYPLASRIPFSPDVWEAAMASGAVRLIPADIVLELSAFYGEMRGLMAEMDQNRAYVRTILLPNLGAPDSEFYDDAGTLRLKYRWYADHLTYLEREIPRLTEKAGHLREKLEL